MTESHVRQINDMTARITKMLSNYDKLLAFVVNKAALHIDIGKIEHPPRGQLRHMIEARNLLKEIGELDE